MRYALPLTGLLALSFNAYAEEPMAPVVVPPPPMPTTGMESQEGIEPEVTIIQRKDRVVREYRLNGQLYMVKITPTKGPAYYLVDADGDGQLETQSNELDPKILVPAWTIFRW